jgi:hypothetical protein
MTIKSESVFDTERTFDKMSVEDSIRTIHVLIGTGILQDVQSHGHPFKEPAFVSILIQLRHLMALAEKYGKRIDFADDVVPSHVGTKSEVADVTGLIRYVRDAICHPESDKHYLVRDHIQMTFTTFYGKQIHGLIAGPDGPIGLTSDYEDDIAFFYGPQRIYFHRHIIRALKEAKDYLMPIVSAPDWTLKNPPTPYIP